MWKNVIRRQAYYYASAVFILLWLVYFVAIVNQPYIGLNAENISGQWVVTTSDPYGEGYKLGIRAGDLIVKIGTEDVHKYQEINIWGQVEGVSTIEFRKMGTSSDRIIKITKHSISQLTFSDFSLPILGLVFGFVGFITWFKRRFWLQARTLYWLNWFIGLALILAPASERGLFLARELEYIFLSAVPIFLVRFISVFPNEKVIRVNRRGRLILTLMFAIVLIITVLQSARIVHIFDLLRKLVLATMSIGILFTLGNLSASLMMPKNMPERNQANILLLGLSIGFMPLILLTAIPFIFGFHPIMDAHVSSLFISAVPLTWYFVVVNKYLPDAHKFVATLLSYLVAVVIISFLVFYLRLNFNLLTNSSLERYLSILSLLGVLVVCFSFIRLSIIRLLEKYSFLEGKKTLGRRILELKESLFAINEENEMLEVIVNSLEIEGAFIIVEDDKGQYMKKAVGIFLEKPSEQVKLEEFFQAEQRINLEVKILPDDLQAEVYIPFVSNEFRCGIFLGHRSSHVKFEQDELPVITLISSLLAQRYLTTFVIKEMSQEIKDISQKSLNYQRKTQRMQGITGFLFKSDEQERKSIARDIHDGPLQLALDLNRWLDEIAEECTSVEDGKAFKAIAHQREIINNLNFELRSICSDLRPPSLSDLGLYFAIESLCEEIMQNESIQISLETIGFNEKTNLDEDIQTAAYRFVHEGIANAIKHSETNKIQINIEFDQTKLDLIIRDFGKGFDLKKLDDLPLASDHLGLIGMKERLACIDGELLINSVISQGTILKATIPMKGRRINRATGK